MMKFIYNAEASATEETDAGKLHVGVWAWAARKGGSAGGAPVTRKIVITLILSGLSAAQAFAQAFHAPLDSGNFGLGDGVVLQETKREDQRSWFKITRNYDYKTDRSVAWGVGQGCFTLCALRQVALERGFSQFTRKFRVLDGSDLRPFRKGEEIWDLKPDQFYILTEWSLNDARADTKKLLEQGSIPVNDPTLARFCENWKVTGKGNR